MMTGVLLPFLPCRLCRLCLPCRLCLWKPWQPGRLFANLGQRWACLRPSQREGDKLAVGSKPDGDGYKQARAAAMAPQRAACVAQRVRTCACPTSPGSSWCFGQSQGQAKLTKKPAWTAVYSSRGASAAGPQPQAPQLRCCPHWRWPVLGLL